MSSPCSRTHAGSVTSRSSSPEWSIPPRAGRWCGTRRPTPRPPALAGFTGPGKPPAPALAGFARTSASAPEVAPAVVVDDLHATLAQGVQPRGVAVRLPVVDASDIGVDGHLGAHDAGRGARGHHLARLLGARLDERVLLAVDAAARARRGRVAAVGQAAGVAVVADPEDLGQVGGGDHRPDLEAKAGGALGQLLGHAHVDLLEGYAIP